MKLYVISGLGADRKVFENIVFPSCFSEIIYLDWLMPLPEEPLNTYVMRLAEPILKEEEKFCLLGYSFGGIMVQEIHKLRKAEKTIILGSIKSHKEKTWAFLIAKKLRFSSVFAEKYLHEDNLFNSKFSHHIFPPKLRNYFTVKDPQYLKWSIIRILEWEFEEIPEVVQVMGEKDLVFPPKKSNPQYIIPNATHLFPVTKAKEVSEILNKEFEEKI